MRSDTDATPSTPPASAGQRCGEAGPPGGRTSSVASRTRAPLPDEPDRYRDVGGPLAGPHRDAERHPGPLARVRDGPRHHGVPPGRRPGRRSTRARCAGTSPPRSPAPRRPAGCSARRCSRPRGRAHRQAAVHDGAVGHQDRGARQRHGGVGRRRRARHHRRLERATTSALLDAAGLCGSALASLTRESSSRWSTTSVLVRRLQPDQPSPRRRCGPSGPRGPAGPRPASSPDGSTRVRGCAGRGPGSASCVRTARRRA